MYPDWNLSLFHYRNHGAAVGRLQRQRVDRRWKFQWDYRQRGLRSMMVAIDRAGLAT